MNYWPERLFALLLAGFVTLTLLYVYSIRTSIVGATDFKTIYASAWDLRHAKDAYQFESIAAVLSANGVIPPPTAYGHNAVYPPFTLALLAPVTFLPLLPAIWLWCIAGLIAIAAAIAMLAQAAGEEFGVSRGGRFLLILLAVLYPVFTFATITQNVSLMAAALSVLAVTTRDRVWPRSIGLAIAVLLKPHVALWPALAMMLMKDKVGRRVALRAVLLCILFVTVSGLWMAFDHQLGPHMRSYLTALRGEMASGSMSPTRLDVVAAGLQITSLSSLLGFWPGNDSLLKTLWWIIIASLAGILLWSTNRVNRLSEETPARSRFLVAGAWCSFGLIATYHRAHDALILLVMFPWLISSLGMTWPFSIRRLPVLPGLLLGCMMLLAAIIPQDSIGRSDASHVWRHMLFLRQAPLFSLILTALLAVQMILLARTQAEQR